LEQINYCSLSPSFRKKTTDYLHIFSFLFCFLTACVHTPEQEVSKKAEKDPEHKLVLDVELSRDFKENIFNPKHLSDLDVSLRNLTFNKTESDSAVRQLVQLILSVKIAPDLHFIERFFVSSAAETLKLEADESELLQKWILENRIPIKKLVDLSKLLKDEEFILENESSFKNNLEKILKLYLIYSSRVLQKPDDALLHFQQQQTLLNNLALFPTGIFNEDGLISSLFSIYRASLYEAQLIAIRQPELKEQIKKTLKESFLTRTELRNAHLANARLFFWSMRYKQFFIQMGQKFRLASYPLESNPQGQGAQLVPLLNESLILQSMSKCTLEQLAFIEQISQEDEIKNSENIDRRLCQNEKSKPLEAALRNKAKILPEFYLKLEKLEKVAIELGLSPANQNNRHQENPKGSTMSLETKKQLTSQFVALQQEIAVIVKESFADLKEQEYFSQLIVAGSLYTGAEASLLKTWKTWAALKAEMDAF
jgi:hypothetical protein